MGQINKIPAWLQKKDKYKPLAVNERFLHKTILTIMTKLTVLREGVLPRGTTLPIAQQIIFMLMLFILISLSRTMGFLLVVLAFLLVYLSTLSAKYILNILKPAMLATVFSLLIMLPAAVYGYANIWLLPMKIFLTTSMVAAMTFSIPFYVLTGALVNLHVPALFIITLDMTVRYIVLLGNTAEELLVSLKLRSVGKDNKKYYNLGSIMGMTFLKAHEYADETYKAMRCRCFTGEYNKATVKHSYKWDIIVVIAALVATIIFIYIEEL